MAHPNALRAKFGHAKSIGGSPYVERAAVSDDVMGDIVSMVASDRKTAMTLVAKELLEGRTNPSQPRLPAPRGRVKVRWNDELIARLKREAVWCKTIPALTRKLGLPKHCEGSVERACRRHAPGSPATNKRPATRKSEPLVDAMKRAA